MYLCTHLKPVDGALDVPQARDKAIPLHQTQKRHPQLPTALVAAVNLLESLVPERQRLLRDGAAEPERSDHVPPDLVDNKVRRRDWAAPLLEEGE